VLAGDRETIIPQEGKPCWQTADAAGCCLALQLSGISFQQGTNPIPVVDAAMETNVQEQFQTLYPSRRMNEAALFVGNRVILAEQHDLPVYEGQLDQFVSPEAAHRQQAIRFVHVNID